MNNIIYVLAFILTFAFISDAHQNDFQNEQEKRQFIAVPRVGRSTNDLANLNSLNQIKTSPPIPLNKILNHIYSDLLKRQGYIPTPRVGRSSPTALDNDSFNKQQTIDFYSSLMSHRSKRSPASASASDLDDALDNLNNINLLTNKRQFLPPARVGRRSFNDDSLTKESVANQLSSDGQLDNTLTNFANYLQEDSNSLESAEVLNKLVRYLNKNHQLANALSEKRATFSSRNSRSAPLTPRLGRSHYDVNSSDESNDQSNEIEKLANFLESLGNNRLQRRTALTPRIGKRSSKIGESMI